MSVDKSVRKIRKEVGLAPINVKNRECLRCDIRFESQGSEHRMCRSCRVYAQNYAPDCSQLLSVNG